jgi:hypothetical protein
MITCININRNLRVFATGSQDFNINLYNLYNHSLIRNFYHPSYNPI